MFLFHDLTRKKTNTQLTPPSPHTLQNPSLPPVTGPPPEGASLGGVEARQALRGTPLFLRGHLSAGWRAETNDRPGADRDRKTTKTKRGMSGRSLTGHVLRDDRHVLLWKEAGNLGIQKTRWNPRTRMHTRSKNYICPNDTLVGHSSGTLL